MNDFKLNDYVICVNNKDVEQFLTLSKKYSILTLLFNNNRTPTTIAVVSDVNSIDYFDINRFKKINYLKTKYKIVKELLKNE